MTNQYSNPLVERYGSKDMLFVFSPDFKFSTWRKLWLALAEGQKELGIAITDEQIQELKDHLYDIDFEKAAAYEKEFRHDVMAHVHTLGDVAPKAKPIIHLGATSAYVGDNTDVIQLKEGLKLVKKKLVNVLHEMQQFIDAQKALPTLGFTHYQPAQLTTVGKRATLWAQSFLLDLEELDFLLDSIRLRGVKGTTGTGVSFRDLFENDYQKYKDLDAFISKKMNFEGSMAVTGQTYDRKVDSKVVNALANIAQSAHKMTNDIRLLANLKEMEEPFGKKQIGSSAMAYKRNPMKCERISALSKFVISLQQSSAMVAATQWFERSLDDSANKRLTIPQAFLAIDAILVTLHSVVDGLVVYPKVIEQRIFSELPFMITEYIIMEGVKKGGDRQELHELIRQHSIEAAKQVKLEGKPNDLIDRMGADERFPFDKEHLLKIASPERFIGFSIQQTEEFLANSLQPVIDNNKDLLGVDYEIKV